MSTASAALNYNRQSTNDVWLRELRENKNKSTIRRKNIKSVHCCCEVYKKKIIAQIDKNSYVRCRPTFKVKKKRMCVCLQCSVSVIDMGRFSPVPAVILLVIVWPLLRILSFRLSATVLSIDIICCCLLCVHLDMACCHCVLTIAISISI